MRIPPIPLVLISTVLSYGISVIWYKLPFNAKPWKQHLGIKREETEPKKKVQRNKSILLAVYKLCTIFFVNWALFFLLLEDVEDGYVVWAVVSFSFLALIFSVDLLRGTHSRVILVDFLNLLMIVLMPVIVIWVLDNIVSHIICSFLFCP